MNSVMDLRLQQRQRLAWVVLFGGFAVFLSLAIATPLLVRFYLQNSTNLLTILAQSNQGTLTIDNISSPPRAAIPGEAPQTVVTQETVLTDIAASGLLLVYKPRSEDVLTRLQLYSGTTVQITDAKTPRFSLSNNPHIFQFELISGRVRLVVAESRERPFQVTVNTPHSAISILEPGEYSIFVNNDITQLTVQQGSAQAQAQGETLTLVSGQRGEVAAESVPTGPFSPERDLVVNGSFAERWSRWTRLSWNVERANQPEGQMEIAEILGENGLQIIRFGEGHADVGMRQVINQDVTDVESLLVEVDLRILDQSLGVCGTVGSECPIFLRIEYDDINGNPQVWQQGFYARGQIGADGPPDVCVSCPPPRFEHVQAPLGQLFFYRTDIISELQRMGFSPPRRIKNLSLIASGHSFAVEILDISLLVNESVSNGG